MSIIAIVASPGTFMVSIGAMIDAHARLGEPFATNPALGDYASMHTRLAISSLSGDNIEFAGGRTMKADTRFAQLDGPSIIYLPSFQVTDPDAAIDMVRREAGFHEWLRQQNSRGSRIAACGASILHLCASGLAVGAGLTAPPRLHSPLVRAFPAVRLGDGEALSERGRLLSAPRDRDAHQLVLRLMELAFAPEVARGLAEREPPPGKRTSITDPLVLRAQTLIRERFARDIRIADLAAELGTSHQTLIRRFRLAGQEAPRAYLQRLRVESAAISLVETDRPVAEIAHLVGYSDIPSFRTVFQARMGMTPGQWRRRKRKPPAN